MLISPGELASARRERRIQVLDIRTREEFETVKIEGAELFSQELLGEMIGGWEKDTEIAIVDHRGERALDAAAYFAGHGFTRVRALRGGIDAWRAEVDPSLPRYTLE